MYCHVLYNWMSRCFQVFVRGMQSYKLLFIMRQNNFINISNINKLHHRIMTQVTISCYMIFILAANITTVATILIQSTLLLHITFNHHQINKRVCLTAMLCIDLQRQSSNNIKQSMNHKLFRQVYKANVCDSRCLLFSSSCHLSMYEHI
jgi:hypothetical protein